jgi:plasmid maintenance system killer protein
VGIIVAVPGPRWGSPGNDLKKVAGSKSTWQIRIDGKYRVRFTWDGRDASDVEVGDSH